MYFFNGYVYGSEPKEKISIIGAKPLDDMMMILTFSSGENRLFDASILHGPVYQPLQASEVFRNVQIDHGVVTWMDGDIDCSPEFMYKHSYQYTPVS